MGSELALAHPGHPGVRPLVSLGITGSTWISTVGPEWPAGRQARANRCGTLPHVRPGSGIKVLVVDDSKAARELLCATLEDCPTPRSRRRRAASTPSRSCPRHQFDLIITDINMPDINGLELINFVKKNPSYRDAALHHLHRDRSRIEQRGLALGAAEYLDQALRAAARFWNSCSVPGTRRSAGGVADGCLEQKALQEFLSEAQEIVEAFAAICSRSTRSARRLDPELVNAPSAARTRSRAWPGMFGVSAAAGPRAQRRRPARRLAHGARRARPPARSISCSSSADLVDGA